MEHGIEKEKISEPFGTQMFQKRNGLIHSILSWKA